jgi:YggT family protein
LFGLTLTATDTAQLFPPAAGFNVRNQFVGMIADFLYRITEPVLKPIRNMMPNLGGLDISPVILILLIYFIQNVIRYYIYPNVF